MFTWFKELFILAGMLFKKTSNLNDVEILKMKYFPFKNFSYMAWCGKIVTRRDVTIEQMGQQNKNHEYGHLMQAKHYKYFIQYYLVYVWEWLKGCPLKSTMAAYYTIPFEVQAYANQHNPNYDYNRDDLKKRYTLKKRQKQYKSRKYDWKYYIKTL